MQLDDRSPERKITVAPSLALDLAWVMHGASSPQLRAQHPAVEAVYSQAPEIEPAVLGFWPNSDLRCFTELQVLAYHAGVLFETDPEIFFDGLSRGIQRDLGDMALASETDSDRITILGRIEKLRRSATLRKQYLELLRSIWVRVDEWWRREGLPGAERTSVVTQQALASGLDWRTLASRDCETFIQHLPQIDADYREGRASIVMVPCAFFGKGLYLSFPDQIVVGMSAIQVDEVARRRTEQLASRLRALGDPTRLAILAHLATKEQSIGELAELFSLSQPTVSNHMKILREAGLVTADRAGTRLCLKVSQAAVSQLTEELVAAFSR